MHVCVCVYVYVCIGVCACVFVHIIFLLDGYNMVIFAFNVFLVTLVYEAPRRVWESNNPIL